MRRAVLPATVLSFPLSITPALATPAAAQSPATRVSVRGTVLDPSRAPIAGMYGNKRVTADVDRPLNDKLAFRVNGMFEDSGSFRDGVDLKRHGITPTLTWVPSSRTTITARYEYRDDSRVADRGITSFQGRPANVPDDTFCGNPNASDVAATVNLASATIEHRRGAVSIRNHTSFGGYDRSYQNFVPGAVSADQAQVAITAYNNATQRNNLFNQTDLTYIGATGAVRHTVLAGAEFGIVSSCFRVFAATA